MTRVEIVRAVCCGLRRPSLSARSPLPCAPTLSERDCYVRSPGRRSAGSSAAWNGHSVDLITHLEQRGLVESASNLDGLRELTRERRIGLYCGFDPTAESLHLGNLLGVIVLDWFRRYGHRSVALIGGATGRVGDPSGKQKERPLLSESQLQENASSIGRLLSGIFDRDSKNGLELKNNLDWFGEMKFLEFLRDVGKHARLGTMLSKDSVKSRLMAESGISFTEFSYQLLQGYDFYHLCRTEGVALQIGGSDQWGNITAGLDLIKRLWPAHQSLPPTYGLTFPLLVDSEGKKFGKSEGDAVWLSREKLSPYRFYQYLFSTTDADVVRFLKMLTFLPLDEIAAVERAMAEAPASGYVPNSAQKKLAAEVTRFVHGEEGLKQALQATDTLRPGSDTTLDAASLAEVAGEAPTATLDRAEVVDALLTDVLVKVKMQQSKGAVKRMIRNGGVRVNNCKIEDEGRKLTEADLIEGEMLLLAAGKKNKLLLKIQ